MVIGRRSGVVNVLVQARALGAAPQDLEQMRALIAKTHELERFEPGAPL